MSPLFAGAIVFIGLVTFASTMYWRLGAMAALKSEPGNRHRNHDFEQGEAARMIPMSRR